MNRFYTPEPTRKATQPKTIMGSVITAVFALSLMQSLNAQVSGVVYRDFNSNGAKNNTASYNEPGAAGITVKAYDETGALLGTTTSGTNGSYSFSAGTIPAATKVRLEFSGWNAADFPAAFGANNKTSVQFVTAPATNADLGMNYLRWTIS